MSVLDPFYIIFRGQISLNVSKNNATKNDKYDDTKGLFLSISAINGYGPIYNNIFDPLS